MKDARRYERLAGIVRDRYPRTTGPAIQSWVKRGVFPSAGIRHTGFGVREISEPAHIEAHLRGLCHYRYDLGMRDIAVIGVLLWIDGFPVREATVREGLVRLARPSTKLLKLIRGPERKGLSVRDQLSQAAAVAVYDQGFGRRVEGGGASQSEVASGLGDLAAAMMGLGLDVPIDRDALNELGKVIGLDRARRYGRQAGHPTWSPQEPAEALLDVVPKMQEQVLFEGIQRATSEQLAQACADARVIAAAFSFVAEHPDEPAYRDSGLIQLAGAVPPSLMAAYVVIIGLANPAANEFAGILRAMAANDHHSG